MLTIEGVRTFISRDEKGALQDCLHWNINIDYSLQSLANVESSLEAESQLCLGQEGLAGTDSLVGVHLAVIAVASLSLFLAWRQVYFVSKEYLFFKRREGREKTDKEDGVSSSRFKGHNHW